MISCTEFILAYNELFKFLHHRHGRQALDDFWIYISDNYLTDLRDLLMKRGLEGVKDYWTRVCTEEGDKFKITFSDDPFILDVEQCTSIGKLRKNKHVDRHPEYCKHCDILYRRIYEDYGYSYNIEYVDVELGKCRMIVQKKKF